jgi:hypothetical protein
MTMSVFKAINNRKSDPHSNEDPFRDAPERVTRQTNNVERSHKLPPPGPNYYIVRTPSILPKPKTDESK